MSLVAIDEIDLLTYDGEDPFLIHESACQFCHAKQSETQLTRCSTCTTVWYCSEGCVEADSELHRVTCNKIQHCQANIDTRIQELRVQHQILDPYVPRENVPVAARQVHENLRKLIGKKSCYVYSLSVKGGTSELLEVVLDLRLKCFRMLNARTRSWAPKVHFGVAAGLSAILIRLDRLEDAWRFIRNTMVMYKNIGRSPVMIEYEPHDRYTDCLEWVCSSYPIAECDNARKRFHFLILGLLIIKLRIRVAAARSAWKDTVNIFLQTKRGEELEPVKSVFEEYFSLSDDSVQLEQIRQLMSIIHSFDSSMIPNRLNDTSRILSLCLHRTPKSRELLSEELEAEGFVDRAKNNKILLANAMRRKNRVIFLIVLLFVLLFARTVLIPRPEPCFHHLGLAIDFASFWIVGLDIVDKLAAGCACLPECGYHEGRLGLNDQVVLRIVMMWVAWISMEAVYFYVLRFPIAQADWTFVTAAVLSDLMFLWWVKPLLPDELFWGLKKLALRVKSICLGD